MNLEELAAQIHSRHDEHFEITIVQRGHTMFDGSFAIDPSSVAVEIFKNGESQHFKETGTPGKPLVLYGATIEEALQSAMNWNGKYS